MLAWLSVFRVLLSYRVCDGLLALAGSPSRVSVVPGRYGGAGTERHESVDRRDYQYDPAEPWADYPECVSLSQHQEATDLYG
jgi:hypothetical protein